MNNFPVTDEVSKLGNNLHANRQLVTPSEYMQASEKCHAEASEEEIYFQVALNRLDPVQRHIFRIEQNYTFGTVHHP